jgi:alpha-galactosidase
LEENGPTSTTLNLYRIGYDSTEGYAIEKDGKRYYALYSDRYGSLWKGEIELRGLPPGKYRVLDYVDEKDLGMIDATNPRLSVEFTGELLLEVSGS